jgi:hypothetical protein
MAPRRTAAEPGSIAAGVRAYGGLRQAGQHGVGVAQQVIGQGRLVGEQLGQLRPFLFQVPADLCREVADRRAEGRVDGRARRCRARTARTAKNPTKWLLTCGDVRLIDPTRRGEV